MCPPSAFSSSDTELVDSSSFVPNTEVAKAAFELAISLLHPAILKHSIRVYLYAKALAKQSHSVYITETSKHDLLFIACILHDIGTSSIYNGSQRFEVEGGDAAAELLGQYEISEEDRRQVWMAIALHTSPHIAERISELSRLVREAVLTDFGRKAQGYENFEELKQRLEGRFGRGNIEKVLGDAVVGQAKNKPEKAPMASWPGVLYRAHLAEPEWEGVNKGF